MIFHTFGDESNKKIMFLHGVLTPWQIWEDAISAFEKEYFVIVPELDGHTEEEKTIFESVEKEADQIEEYIRGKCDGELYMLAGLSMGGRIAYVVAGRQGIRIENLVLDGAPLMKMPSILIKVMEGNYKSIIKKSKAREPKVLRSCEKDFLPKRFIEDYLKIADNMEESSISNILKSVFTDLEFKELKNVEKIFFLHGTKGNESVSRKAAIKMKEVNPHTTIKVYKGYAHAELACFESEKWVEDVRGLIYE